MASAAYIDKHRHERHISMGKLGVVLANVALWGVLIAVLARIVG